MAESITIKVNQMAPNFALIDIFGKKINLNNYKGKKVLVGFFRHAGCPFCNVRVHNLQRHQQAFEELGLRMIFFFESTSETLSKHKFHTDLNPIPLIADPEKVWYNQYGIENSKLKSAISHITSIFPTAIRAKLKGIPVHMMEGKESINTIPAEFLINENGIVKVVHYARGLNDRMRMETILDFAKNKLND